MGTVEMLQFSLRNAFGILHDVTTDLTQEQADWTPPGMANPIGATYWHTIAGSDEILHGWIRHEPPLSQTGGWKERALLVDAPQVKEGCLAYMQAIRVDVQAIHGYAQALAQAAESWLAGLAPEALETKLQTPIGELTLGQMLETFIVWHINAHCGEIAALKGCLGVQGYPF